MANKPDTQSAQPRTRRAPANGIDRVFHGVTLGFAVTVPVLILLLAAMLTWQSLPAITRFGWQFLTQSVIDPVHEQYGVLFAIYGTVISSLLALLFAVPVGLGAAVFLAELAPRWLRGPLSFLVELLAAVPSIVYGLWGIFVLIPLLIPAEEWLAAHYGFLPLFRLPEQAGKGFNMLAAGLILAIMILPYITSVSREVIQAVPRSQREAAYALGATRWEALAGPVLRGARSGILGAIILGLGRALGETMAVTMVIGNSAKISASLFAPGYTMPSLLANQFNEASGDFLSVMVEVALVLLVITLVVNALARTLIWRVARGAVQGVQE